MKSQFESSPFPTMTPRWEHFPHETDIGARGFGTTKAEASAQAALALTAAVADLATVIPQEAVSIECEAPDGGGWRAQTVVDV